MHLNNCFYSYNIATGALNSFKKALYMYLPMRTSVRKRF